MLSKNSVVKTTILVYGIPFVPELFDATITNIEIEKSIEMEASHAKITIAASKERFGLLSVMPIYFGLGFVITILVTTQTSIVPIPVFHGVIFQKELTNKFSGDWEFHITCHDVKLVMKQHKQYNVALPVTVNYMPTLQLMFLDYLSALLLLGPALVVEKTVTSRPGTLQAGDSDYSFVCNLAQNTGNLFFVDYGIIHFHPPLVPCGVGILDCSRHALLNISMRTEAYNKTDSQVVGSSTSNMLGVKLPSIPIPSALGILPPLGVGTSMISYLKPWFVRKLGAAVEIENTGAATPAEGALAAQAKLYQDSLESCALDCTCDGVLLYPLNSLMTVVGYGTMFDGLYYLKSVGISIKGNSATTKLTLISNVSNL